MILDTPDKDLVIPFGEMDDEEMIKILAEKVQAYLDCNINLLMSYLYRLDVLEHKIKSALSNISNEPGNVLLARLIWERQKQRLETKKSYQVRETIDSDLEW